MTAKRVGLIPNVSKLKVANEMNIKLQPVQEFVKRVPGMPDFQNLTVSKTYGEQETCKTTKIDSINKAGRS